MRRGTLAPGQGYHVSPNSLTETADTLTHNQNRSAIRGSNPIPMFQESRVHQLVDAVLSLVFSKCFLGFNKASLLSSSGRPALRLSQS